MNDKMHIENWCGYEIRFVEHDGSWWAVLKDICDALGLKSYHVAARLDPNMTAKKVIETERIRPRKYGNGSNEVVKSYTQQRVTIVNELAIYEALFASKKPEARKFRLWSASVLKKLRGAIGLEAYEALKLTDRHYQSQIDDLLDRLYYDEETKKVMLSVTVPGGDVEQIEFEEG